MEKNYKDMGIVCAWIVAIAGVGVLSWGLTGSLQKDSLRNAVNKSSSGTIRLGEAIVPHNLYSDRLGTWYRSPDSDDRVLIFSLMHEGIPVPCAVQVAPGAKLSAIVPVAAHTEQSFASISSGTLDVYRNRIKNALLHDPPWEISGYVAPEPEPEPDPEPEPEPMDKEQVAADITIELERMGIENTQVTVVDEGISINLDNIQFDPGTINISVGEQSKLNQISTILAQYRNRNIVISGHSASVGDPRGEQEFSEARARVIADYFIQNGVRTAAQIEVRGYGSTRPVATNNTEAGRQQNRRVEIILR